MALVSIEQIWTVDVSELDMIILDVKQVPNSNLNAKRVQVSYIYLELKMLDSKATRIVTNPHFKELALKSITVEELKADINKTASEVLGIDFNESHITDLLHQYYKSSYIYLFNNDELGAFMIYDINAHQIISSNKLPIKGKNKVYYMNNGNLCFYGYNGCIVILNPYTLKIITNETKNKEQEEGKLYYSKITDSLYLIDGKTPLALQIWSADLQLIKIIATKYKINQVVDDLQSIYIIYNQPHRIDVYDRHTYTKTKTFHISGSQSEDDTQMFFGGGRAVYQDLAQDFYSYQNFLITVTQKAIIIYNKRIFRILAVVEGYFTNYYFDDNLIYYIQDTNLQVFDLIELEVVKTYNIGKQYKYTQIIVKDGVLYILDINDYRYPHFLVYDLEKQNFRTVQLNQFCKTMVIN